MGYGTVPTLFAESVPIAGWGDVCGVVGHGGHVGPAGARLPRGGTGRVSCALGSGGAPSRGRFDCVASSMARSSVAAGWAAGEEGRGARSRTLSV
eukprot:scaffold20236_cov34-Tisochrysis_lutea.AAC.2